MRAPGPEEALEAFRPGVDGPWDRPAAAHLSRRIAFGMPADSVARILELGPEKSVSDFLAEKPESEDAQFTSGIAMQIGSLDSAQGSWVFRMLRGASPAREKLALFWHGHFATSERKVENVGLMLRQIELLRAKGSGPFEDLVSAIARDPAMLVWLDGNSNRRGKPNENFARELMELFTLGIGNYTEQDIKEAARAFTGWHVKNDEYWFNARAHDEGEKTVFGQKGAFGGDDIIRLCVEKPASAELIASKLFEFYVHLHPGPELRRELGKAFVACGRRTTDFLRRLLASRLFYSSTTRRALVSTPADFTIGSLRTLGATANANSVAKAMRHMGQELLAPPSVKGWDMGEGWLSSTTLLARYRFAVGASSAEGGSAKEIGATLDWDSLGQGADLVGRFFPDGLSGSVEKELLSGSGGDPRALAAACMQIPEYQFI